MKQISSELLETEDDSSGAPQERAAYRQIQFGVMRMQHAIIGYCHTCDRLDGPGGTSLLGHAIATPVPIHVGLKNSAMGMQLQVANRPAMPGLCTVCAMLNVYSAVIRKAMEP